MKKLKIKKVYPTLFLFVFIFLVLGGLVFAQDKGLEVTYPQIPGVDTPTVVKTPLPQYVKYIFNFGIWIAGFVAFGSLVYGGVRYLTSVGDPSKTDDAKDQIFAGILGLIVLLSSYLILANLNPQLLTLKVSKDNLGTPGETIGVYLCKDSSFQNCTVYGSNSDTLAPAINDQVAYIHFKNTDTTVFGAVLHEDSSRQGTCQVLLADGPVKLPSGAASSITVFQRGTATGAGVTLYECENYDTTSKTGSIFDRHTCQKWGPYQNVQNNNLGQIGNSIQIDPESKYLAVVFQGANGTQKCEVFTTSDPGLATNYIGDCGLWHNMGCFTSLTVLPIK